MKKIKPYKVLVTGDREWRSVKAIAREMKKLWDLRIPIMVIHGNARGADSMAHDIAYAMDFAVSPYPAEWAKYGLAAGPTRNQKMLDRDKPDLVLAFHSNLFGASKGTLDMVRRAHAAGIEVRIIPQ